MLVAADVLLLLFQMVSITTLIIKSMPIVYVYSAFPASSLNELIQTLEGHGFQPHLTTLGGPGLGVLTIPSKLGQASDQLRDAVRTHDEGEGMVVPKRAGLREADKEGLHTWAERLGRWVYA